MTKENTNISNTLDACNINKIRYDNNIKRIFADKQIAARILKYTLDEFMDMPVDDIISCIYDSPQINVCTEPGLTNLPLEQIKGDATEDIVLNEGSIYFDVKFKAKENKYEEIYRILVDFESQNNTNPNTLGYHIKNRIIYYICRMISSQKETEFTKSDYDNLKKVKSIWICMDAKNDSIVKINPSLKVIHGTPDREYHFDQIECVIVHIRSLNKSSAESKNTLIAMLEDLIRIEDKEIKKSKLHNKYNIKMTKNFERSVSSMFSFSDALIDAVSESIEQEGINKGISKERINAIIRMLDADFTKEQILLCKYTEDEIRQAEELRKDLTLV